MILRRFRRTPQDDSIASLYGAIVAQAREPTFYRAYSVPDTVNGRFEMIVLHAALLLRRLDAETAAPLRKLGQGVFDRFCADMDANLREMGVGDLAVPRKMHSVGEAFYGRKRAYDAALAASDASLLVAALSRNVYAGDAAGGAGAACLAAYVRATAGRLDAQAAEALHQGRIAFSDPLEFAAGTGA